MKAIYNIDTTPVSKTSLYVLQPERRSESAAIRPAARTVKPIQQQQQQQGQSIDIGTATRPNASLILQTSDRPTTSRS